METLFLCLVAQNVVCPRETSIFELKEEGIVGSLIELDVDWFPCCSQLLFVPVKISRLSVLDPISLLAIFSVFIPSQSLRRRQLG